MNWLINEPRLAISSINHQPDSINNLSWQSLHIFQILHQIHLKPMQDHQNDSLRFVRIWQILFKRLKFDYKSFSENDNSTTRLRWSILDKRISIIIGAIIIRDNDFVRLRIGKSQSSKSSFGNLGNRYHGHHWRRSKISLSQSKASWYFISRDMWWHLWSCDVILYSNDESTGIHAMATFV